MSSNFSFCTIHPDQCAHAIPARHSLQVVWTRAKLTHQNFALFEGPVGVLLVHENHVLQDGFGYPHVLRDSFVYIDAALADSAFLRQEEDSESHAFRGGIRHSRDKPNRGQKAGRTFPSSPTALRLVLDML